MRREEARDLLAEVREGETRARRTLDPFLGGLLLIWGTVYLVGYGLVTLRSPLAGPAWAVLSVAGFLLSYGLGFRVAGHLRTPSGRALGALWAGFGLAFLALVLAGDRLADGAFSLAVNLLVGLALWQSGVLLARPPATAAGAALMLANALLFAYLPGIYAPALAGAGLLAAGAGLWMVRRGLR